MAIRAHGHRGDQITFLLGQTPDEKQLEGAGAIFSSQVRDTVYPSRQGR